MQASAVSTPAAAGTAHEWQQLLETTSENKPAVHDRSGGLAGSRKMPKE
jgi:hypothetical protein